MRAADRWMQFVDTSGTIYYYDFATGNSLGSLSDVIDYENPDEPTVAP